jgi:hypothetical protein
MICSSVNLPLRIVCLLGGEQNPNSKPEAFQGSRSDECDVSTAATLVEARLPRGAWLDACAVAGNAFAYWGDLFVPSTLSAFCALEHLHYGSCVSVNHDPNEQELCRAAIAALFGSIRDRSDFPCCKQLHDGTRLGVYGVTITASLFHSRASKANGLFVVPRKMTATPFGLAVRRNLGCWYDDGPANPAAS